MAWTPFVARAAGAIALVSTACATAEALQESGLPPDGAGGSTSGGAGGSTSGSADGSTSGSADGSTSGGAGGSTSGGAGGSTSGGAGGSASGGSGSCGTPYVIDWENPPAITPSGSSWSVGASVNGKGPDDAIGDVFLATVPDGSYPHNANDTAMFRLDLSGFSGCAPKLRFRLWRDSETVDAGNLQVSTLASPSAAATASGWTVVDANYDYPAISACGGCFLDGLPIWTSFVPGALDVEADLSPYAGQVVHLRFTFHSDGLVAYGGLYVGDMTLSDQ